MATQTNAEKTENALEKTKEKTVKVIVPYDPEEQGDKFVSINERTWLIQRGVEVEVPECVAEVLRQSEIARMEAIRRSQEAAI